MPLSYLPSQSSIPPVGTILAYVGDLNKVPTNWHLCDGTNGTPDLRGRFLEGVTSGIKQFHSAGLPNITGYFGNCEEEGFASDYEHPPVRGAFTAILSYGGAAAERDKITGYNEIAHYELMGDLKSGYWLKESRPLAGQNEGSGYNFTFDASKSNSIYGKSSTVQPNSYTVYYIMRIR